LDGPTDESESSDEDIPVPLTPFGVQITSEQQVNGEELSRVTGDFLHAYFKDELPNMGYLYYKNVALSAEVTQMVPWKNQRRLRARMLQAVDQEIMLSGDVNFEEEPLPDTHILDNLRSAAFAGDESKAAYLDALRNSKDPGLQSTTNLIVYEGDTEFNPSASTRIQPGPSTDDGDDSGFKSYVIAAMAAITFVIFGTALFLYNRKQMRDTDKDGLMSEFSGEAPDAVLLKGDLGASDSIDTFDFKEKVPAIEPEPISLIRDAKTLERAMVRSSYNRSVIEKANEKVERKAIVMPGGDDDDSKTISFAEVIAKCHSLSPRAKGQWQSIDQLLSPINSQDEKDVSQKELLSAAVSADPPTQCFGEMEKSMTSGKSVDSDDPCLEGCGNESPSCRLPVAPTLCLEGCSNESPSCRLLPEESSCGGGTDFAQALVACSPRSLMTIIHDDDDNDSLNEGPAAHNSMAMPSSLVPTVELPPPPISRTMEPTVEIPPPSISMTMNKVSPKRQQIVKALEEGNPSTPFSLVHYTVHHGGSTESHTDDRDEVESPQQIEPSPSPNGRVGIDSHPNVVVEDSRPSNKPLGIAAHPYATVKPPEPLMSP